LTEQCRLGLERMIRFLRHVHGSLEVFLLEEGARLFDQKIRLNDSFS